MGYSLQFFALDAESIANQIRTEPEALLDRMARQVREKDAFDEEELQTALARAAAICEGRLPDDCDPDYFRALCWLMEVVSEEVRIGSFVDFHWWFIEEAGIWPWLLRSRPPFPVPVCSDPSQQVGFLSVEDIERFALPAFDQLPPTDTSEVSYARQEFREVLESLVEDKLDLLAVLV